jgi:hypothetical protein
MAEMMKRHQQMIAEDDARAHGDDGSDDDADDGRTRHDERPVSVVRVACRLSDDEESSLETGGHWSSSIGEFDCAFENGRFGRRPFRL